MAQKRRKKKPEKIELHKTKLLNISKSVLKIFSSFIIFWFPKQLLEYTSLAVKFRSIFKVKDLNEKLNVVPRVIWILFSFCSCNTSEYVSKVMRIQPRISSPPPTHLFITWFG